MTKEEAVASLRKSLQEGDALIKSQTWSGGGFKSEAVRVLLAEIERRDSSPAVVMLARRPAGCPRGDGCSGNVVSFDEGKDMNTCGLAGCMNNYNPTHGGCGIDHVIARD